MEFNLFFAALSVIALICLRAYFGHKRLKKKLKNVNGKLRDFEDKLIGIDSEQREIKRLQAKLNRLVYKK